MFALAKCNPASKESMVACAPSCTHVMVEELRTQEPEHPKVGYGEQIVVNPSPGQSPGLVISLEHPEQMELEHFPHAIAEAKAHGRVPAEVIATAEQTYTARVLQKHAERQLSERLAGAMHSGEHDQGQPRNAQWIRTYTTVPMPNVTTAVPTTLLKGVTQVEAQVLSHQNGYPPKDLLWAGPAVQIGRDAEPHDLCPLPLTPRDNMVGSDYVPYEGERTASTASLAVMDMKDMKASDKKDMMDMKVLEFVGAGAGVGRSKDMKADGWFGSVAGFDDKLLGA